MHKCRLLNASEVFSKMTSFLFIDAVKVTYPTMTDDLFERQAMTWFHHSKTRFQRQDNRSEYDMS